jgi:excisionase family DNA binding protein
VAAPAAPPAAAEDAAPAAGAGATLSLGQAAHALGISTTTARRWADDGRLPSTRTAGGHRRFAVAEVRRLLAERGRPALAPTEPPKRALPTLAALVEAHGATLSEMSWRGLYGDLRSGFFTDPAGAEAAGLWTAALASAAGTGNYEMLHEATTALMRRAEQAGTSVLERHVAVERFAELLVRTLGRRACPREEIVEVRRLFVSLAHGQLAAVG